MLIKTQHTTLFQVFCEIVINSHTIFKSIKGPDNICQKDLQA